MPTKAEIVRTFEMYNACLFGGRLQLPNIMVRRMNDCARWYEPEPERDHDRLEPGYYAMNSQLGLLVLSSSAQHRMTWRATLLHELAHMAVPEHENDHHGPLFLAECNRLGALIGLEPCTLEDAWMWPAHHLNLEEDESNILDEDDSLDKRVPRARRRRRPH